MIAFLVRIRINKKADLFVLTCFGVECIQYKINIHCPVCIVIIGEY